MWEDQFDRKNKKAPIKNRSSFHPLNQSKFADIIDGTSGLYFSWLTADNL